METCLLARCVQELAEALEDLSQSVTPGGRSSTDGPDHLRAHPGMV